MSIEGRHLVLGSRGFQGGAVARALQAHGAEVRGFARADVPPAPNAPDIPTVVGDLTDPTAVLGALEGITHVSAVLPLVYEPETVEAMIATLVSAARSVGVQRVVYNTNTPLPVGDTGFAAYETRRTAEKMLTESGLPVVVVRPPVYLDNLFSPWNGPALVNDGVLAYPLPVGREVAWISHDDLAAATLAALHVPGLEGATIPLGGPDVVTGDGLAAAFGQALEREVSYVQLAPDQFEAALGEVLPASSAAGVAGIYRWAAEGREPDLFAADHGEVERLLGVRFPGVAGWVAAQPWHIWAGQHAS